MNNQKTFLSLLVLFLAVSINSLAQNYISRVWVSDSGDGTFKNPVLHADYSDPDVCRIGDDYYMTSSSFNCVPGLPILHSRDLINWKLVNHAVQRLVPDTFFSKPQHAKGIWAPSIREHKGELYIYYGDPDHGIFMTKANDPLGNWDPLVMVKEGKGLIDPSPLFDDDGQAYLVHAYAGSRAGIKSVILVTRLTPDGKKAIGESRIVYDGHDIDETIEGPKFYKRNGYYYIFAPAGGVTNGWQVVLRSKNVFGPYERRMVLAQGSTDVNGPHQGAWVTTPKGEDWFFHFQDKKPYGRIVHLQPLTWENDWPIIGIDKTGDGCGEPGMSFPKPDMGATYPIETPAESDNFSSLELGLQWQWHGNPRPWWMFLNGMNETLNLFSVPLPDDYRNLWDLPNLLLQKFPSDQFTATMKMTFKPELKYGYGAERTGLLVMGKDYSLLAFDQVEEGFRLSQVVCKNADRGSEETINESVILKDASVYLRVHVNSDAQCTFSYSTDGKRYHTLGHQFTAQPGGWIGAKVGTFCSRLVRGNDGGRVEIDWFIID